MALKRLGVTEDMLARLHQERGVIKDLKSIMAGVGDSDVKVSPQPRSANTSIDFDTHVLRGIGAGCRRAVPH